MAMLIQSAGVIAALILGILPILPFWQQLSKDKKYLNSILGVLMIITALAGIKKILDDESTSNESRKNFTSLRKASLTCGNPKNGAPEIGLACDLLNKIYDKPKFRESNIGDPIKVEYFLKEANVTGKTTADIKYLGFETKPREGINTSATNTIWYSSDIKLDDVKDIAYTLIATDIKLKRILLDPNTKGLIQVGTSQNCEKEDYWKVKEIEDSKDFNGETKEFNCPQPSRTQSKKIKRTKVRRSSSK